MAYNPYATYGMSQLYKPRPVSPYAGMPGMSGMGQRQINPGKPPDIGELIKAYNEYQKASAAAEAGAGGGGGFGGLLAGGGAGTGAYYGLGGGSGALSASNALGSGSSIFANSGLGSAGGAWGSAASSAPMAMPNPALFDMSLAQAVNTPVTSSLGAGGFTGSASGAGSAGASGVGGLGSAGNAAGTAGAGGASSAGGASGYAAMTGGPGSLAYWAGPAAFLATAPVWAPALSKVGRKAGKKVGEALGLAGKHNIRIPYDPKNAAKSSVINYRMPGMASLDDTTKYAILDKFRAAGALHDQFASVSDPVLSQTKSDNASRIGFNANQLSEIEKNRVEKKYGKWWRPASVKPEDWLEILDPRTNEGKQQYAAFESALQSYKDADFFARNKGSLQSMLGGDANQRAMMAMGGGSPPPQQTRSSTLSPGIGKDGKRIDYSKRR